MKKLNLTESMIIFEKSASSAVISWSFSGFIVGGEKQSGS